MIWTAETDERLTALAANGLTASQIASALGGYTRNQIIGRCSRQGIKLLGRHWSRQPERAEKAPERPKRIGPDKFRSEASIAARAAARAKAISREPAKRRLSNAIWCDTPTSVSLDELSACHCRWPLTSTVPGESFRFCGQAKAPDHPSYCPEHRDASIDSSSRRLMLANGGER